MFLIGDTSSFMVIFPLSFVFGRVNTLVENFTDVPTSISGFADFFGVPWCFNMGVSKNMVFYPPKSSHFNRVFHYFHHPFWGVSPEN